MPGAGGSRSTTLPPRTWGREGFRSSCGSNRQPNYITVSVTDAAGAPTTGLTAPDFSVDPMIVGPGGALVNITSVTAGRLPGFYFVNVASLLDSGQQRRAVYSRYNKRI